MKASRDLEAFNYTRSLVFLGGEIDLASNDLLHGVLEPWTRDGGPLTIDMTLVTFIDSMAINTLLNALKAAPSGCLLLHGVQRAVARTCHLLGLDSMSGVHISSCERDPYPTGRAFIGPAGSSDVIVRLNRLRDSLDRSRASLAESKTRTEAAIISAVRTRADVRARRLAA